MLTPKHYMRIAAALLMQSSEMNISSR